MRRIVFSSSWSRVEQAEKLDEEGWQKVCFIITLSMWMRRKSMKAD